MVTKQARLMDRLRVEGEKSEDFFAQLSDVQQDRTVYTDGAQWTPRQILAHFSASEISILRLVENIIDGGEGTPEGFDLNAYNERKADELMGESLPSLTKRFRAARAATIARVAQMSDEDLRKMGRHPFLGQASIEDILQLIYRHNQIHQREIRKLLVEA